MKFVLPAAILILLYSTVQAQLKEKGDSTPASFPGGDKAWNSYIAQNLNAQLGAKYMRVKRGQVAEEAIIVSFIVDTSGKIIEVEALNLAEVHKQLADEAIRVISNGPSWIPASINGRKVLYRQKQNVIFRTAHE